MKSLIFTILAILLLSVSSLLFVNAQTTTPTILNWSYGHSSVYGTDYSPETAINASNIGQLQLVWSVEPDPLGGGIEAAPLAQNGILYIYPNTGRGNATVYAFSLTDGSLIWSHTFPNTGPGPHVHYWTLEGGVLWVPTLNNNPSLNCQIFGLDPSVGRLMYNYSNLCNPTPGVIPGNGWKYSNEAGPDLDTQRGILVWGPTGSDSGPRCFISGYSESTGQLLWRWFSVPPATNGTKISDNPGAGYGQPWDQQFAGKGNISPYPGDWGNGSTIGGGCSWGNHIILEKQGIVISDIGNPAPDQNGAVRPGPNLMTDGFVALNITNGQLIWYFQYTPHDISDVDCSWGPIVTNVTVNGAQTLAVVQGCKAGNVYALNALTGALIWTYDPPNVVKLNAVNMGVANDSANMTAAGNVGTKVCPHWAAESTESTDGHSLFVAESNVCNTIDAGFNAPGFPTPLKETTGWNSQNTTFYSLNLNTGQPNWSFYYSAAVHGAISGGGGVVFLAPTDGNLTALSASTGKVLWHVELQSLLSSMPIFASDASGRTMLVVPTGGLLGGSPNNGVVYAFALPVTSSSSGISPVTQTTGISPALFYGVVAAAVILAVVAIVLGATRRRSAPSSTQA